MADEVKVKQRRFRKAGGLKVWIKKAGVASFKKRSIVLVEADEK